jgi:hypothetical protein
MHTWDVRSASRNSLLQDLMGAGQIAGMVDSGLDDNDTTPLHLDFYDWTNAVQTTRIAAAVAGNGCKKPCTCYGQDDDFASGHGTHVAGSIVGNGYLSLLQRGLQDQARSSNPSFDYAWAVGQAPEARIAFAYVAGEAYGLEGTLCGIGDSRLTWQSVYNQGARNVNNSWGNITTTYAGDAISADQVMWEAQDYLVVASAGNAGPGPDTVTQPATAKNILVVGAAGNHRSVWAGDSQTSSLLTDFSSRGPITTGSTGDIRFKPDIVAPGADVLSTRSTFIPNGTITLWQNEFGDGDADGHLDYWWSGGTSMSGPTITGAATIVRQYFQDIQGLGNATPPSAALIKAALVNGAMDMGNGYEANTTAPYGGRNAQGWGMANVEQAITPLAPRSFFYDDFTNITNTTHQSTIGMDGTGDYVQYTVTVADDTEPLKITLTWTDLQTGASGYAVNNLNLLVTAPNATQYRGNVFSGSWSVSGGSHDAVNNTEAVYIQKPATGPWTIRVTDAAHGSGTQPFVLLVSGGLGVTPQTTRTCSGIASCTGRMGTSAQTHYPSIKPLGASADHVPAGGSFTASLRVTNWGTSADTISLSAAATTMTGGNASGFTVTFSPAGPFALASGASQDVTATIAVGSGVADGAYDVSLTAASGGSARKDTRVFALNIQPASSLPNAARIDSNVVSIPGPQISPSFWACPSDPATLWVAYLDGSSHTNSAAKVYAAHSTDGGVIWSKWQVDANDGEHYFAPAIAGSADCSSVTVAWVRETTTSAAPAYSLWLYSRTFSSGAWGSIGTRDSLTGSSSYYMADPAVIYDNDSGDAPDILLAWLHYTGTASTSGIYYSVSTNNGGTWSAAAGAVTAGTHRYPAFALDTANNHIWMAFRYSGTTSDVYVKYWNGNTNTWNAANTPVANTGNRENHPAIAYASGRLWVAWNRYVDWSNPTPELYYTYSTSTLPAIAWGTTYGPYGARLAEHTPPSITGDSAWTYIAYLAYTDSLRGANIYALKVPAAGGAPTKTFQLTSTADDPPLGARGNAGTPQLQWATTNLNDAPGFTGPTLLYSRNAPWANALNSSYLANAGVSQALYNEEEDFDLWLAQVGSTIPTAATLLRFDAFALDGTVVLGWETASETDNLGFNLYRATSAAGARVRLNAQMIPTDVPPGSPFGAAYRYVDRTAKASGTYYYWLEIVDIYGNAGLEGPVEVWLSDSRGKPLPPLLPLGQGSR